MHLWMLKSTSLCWVLTLALSISLPIKLLMLRNFPSIPILLTIFFSNLFVNKYLYFSFLTINMVNCINFLLLNHSLFLEWAPSWFWHSILLMCYWIILVNILCRNPIRICEWHCAVPSRCVLNLQLACQCCLCNRELGRCVCVFMLQSCLIILGFITIIIIIIK